MFCYNLPSSAATVGVLRFISFWGDGLIPIFLVAVTATLFYLKKKKGWAGAIIIAPLAGEIIKQVLKNTLKAPRPYDVGCAKLTVASGFSFPSGHTIFYTIYFGLIAWYLWKEIGSRWAKIASIFPIIMVLSIGYSRVFLGAHWLRDVLFGYLVGGAILLTSIKILNKDGKK